MDSRYLESREVNRPRIYYIDNKSRVILLKEVEHDSIYSSSILCRLLRRDIDIKSA